MKFFTTILSWAIMLTLIAIVVGSIVYVFESAISAQSGFAYSGIVQWFFSLFTLSNGLGILSIGLIVTGSFLLATIFVILLKNGQKFLLKIITQIEE